MNKIQLLDNSTINKIAAGEVVERPSSVVKELVENAIDANASAITIEIKEGGISLIRITDNGNGIPKDQVKTAFIRHATNKIQNIEDLESILSLGFRGEALASIAAVSQLEMVTKTQEDDTGTLIEINGGEFTAQQDAGCSEGTSIMIRNLFYNVPARRKFLKKAGTESGYIADIVHKIALGHPDISFKYINNDSVLLHSSGNNDLKTAVFHVYGKDITKKMLDLEYSSKEYRLFGLIGKPELARANRSYENLFINGRYVKSDIINAAIEETYKTRLLTGKFPVFVLNLVIDPSQVDVNVHPTKLEVRFADEDGIYQFVMNAINSAFKEKVLIPESDWNSKPSAIVNEFMKNVTNEEQVKNDNTVTNKTVDDSEIRNQALKFKKENILPKQNLDITPKNDDCVLREETAEFEIKQTSGIDAAYLYPEKIFQEEKLLQKKEQTVVLQTMVQQSLKEEPILINETTEEKQKYTPFFNHYKIVGQMFCTYWVVEQSNSMFMIDQHAAHERILFEELTIKLKNESMIAQRLLQPVVVNLTLHEKQILKDNLSLLESFGFDIEEFGDTAYALRSVPFIFKEPAGVAYFTEIIDTLGNNSVGNLYDTKVNQIATIACKAAVKANDKLDFQEAKSMIEKLLKLENPFTCPHGRPTIIEMTKYELEKKFKRIQ